MKVKSEREVAQSCPTPSDPMDYSLPGSSVHGIFQARVLEWGAIAFSIASTGDTKCCLVTVQAGLLLYQAPLRTELFLSFNPHCLPHFLAHSRFSVVTEIQNINTD